MRTHYDNLQVARNASPGVIKNAYRALVQQWHPDKHPDDPEESSRKLKIINEAYEILSDPVRRKEHDKWIAEQEIKERPQQAPRDEDKSSSSPQKKEQKKRGVEKGGKNQSSKRARRSREERIASSRVWRKRMLYALIPYLGGFLIANLTGGLLPEPVRVGFGVVSSVGGWMTIFFLVRWIWARLR